MEFNYSELSKKSEALFQKMKLLQSMEMYELPMLRMQLKRNREAGNIRAEMHYLQKIREMNDLLSSLPDLQQEYAIIRHEIEKRTDPKCPGYVGGIV